MTDQQTLDDDYTDDVPSVTFSLRNLEGLDNKITISQETLGLELYVLIKPGDEGPRVEASHLSMDDLLECLAFVLITGMEDTENLTDEGRQSVRDILSILDEDVA